MIFRMGNQVRLGQVAYTAYPPPSGMEFGGGWDGLGPVTYAQSYPPRGMEWGDGWGGLVPRSKKVVLPRSAQAGGGVGYVSEGTVLSREDVEEVTAAAGSQPEVPAGGQPVPSGAPSPAAQAPAAAEGGKFPIAAAGVALATLVAAFVV